MVANLVVISIISSSIIITAVIIRYVFLQPQINTRKATTPSA